MSILKNLVNSMIGAIDAEQKRIRKDRDESQVNVEIDVNNPRPTQDSPAATPPVEPRPTQQPTLIQRMIVGERDEDLPEMPQSQGDNMFARFADSIRNALMQREMNREIQAENERQVISPQREIDERERLLADYAKDNQKEQTFGDVMAGVDPNKEKIDQEEEDRRIRAQRKKELEEKQNEQLDQNAGLWERTKKRFRKAIDPIIKRLGPLGKALGSIAKGYLAVRGVQEGASLLAGAQNNRNLQYSQYNALLATQQAQSQMRQMQRDIETAGEVAESGKQFGDARERYEDSLQPIRNLEQNVMNMLGAKLLDLGTAVNEGFNGVGEYLGFFKSEQEKKGGMFNKPMAQVDMEMDALFLKGEKRAGFRRVGKDKP